MGFMDCIRFFCCVKDNRSLYVEPTESVDDDIPIVVNGESRFLSSMWEKVSEWSLPKRQDTEKRIKKFDEYLALETTKEMEEQGFNDNESVVSVNSNLSRMFDD